MLPDTRLAATGLVAGQADASPAAAPPASTMTPDTASDGASRLREALRVETDRDHRELDAFLGEIWTSRERYAAYLAMNHSAHATLEPVIEEAVAEAPELGPYAPARFALSQDLAALGMRLPPSIPLRADAPRDPASAIGFLYVVEGSRLGARMLHRHVLDASWARPVGTIPTAFFETARGSSNFSRRMAALEPLMREEDAFERALSSAREGFRLFRAAAERAYRTPDASPSGTDR
ncbi:hypothetical protein DYI37_07020 [Fulvimarina endophytica]|uniref:Heme oxygenase n=1 Tax=Fulvimarina endophytica TaxID=2293836 RepID=A0A371X4H3_9HYPH|nr:biliverdin-producing heme oxygenase [Fulvimarina endophytica]RFC64107.1 hypothetical protein DYI37_07020 [Fulvimarina endophytica]